MYDIEGQNWSLKISQGSMQEVGSYQPIWQDLSPSTKSSGMPKLSQLRADVSLARSFLCIQTFQNSFSRPREKHLILCDNAKKLWKTSNPISFFYLFSRLNKACLSSLITESRTMASSPQSNLTIAFMTRIRLVRIFSQTRSENVANRSRTYRQILLFILFHFIKKLGKPCLISLLKTDDDSMQSLEYVKAMKLAALLFFPQSFS